MNVFVLCTGRCGSETFARACSYITNFTAAHESAAPWAHHREDLPYRNLEYPDYHIEVDNRLSWFLGALNVRFGSSAFYVHLRRDREEVSKSLSRRGKDSILYAFASGILQYYGDASQFDDKGRLELARHYYDTVTANINAFLRDKPRSMTIWLHETKEAFPQFWDAIGARGNLTSAMKEFGTRHNPSRSDDAMSWKQ